MCFSTPLLSLCIWVDHVRYMGVHLHFVSVPYTPDNSEVQYSTAVSLHEATLLDMFTFVVDFSSVLDSSVRNAKIIHLSNK